MKIYGFFELGIKSIFVDASDHVFVMTKSDEWFYQNVKGTVSVYTSQGAFLWNIEVPPKGIIKYISQMEMMIVLDENSVRFFDLLGNEVKINQNECVRKVRRHYGFTVFSDSWDTFLMHKWFSNVTILMNSIFSFDVNDEVMNPILTNARAQDVAMLVKDEEFFLFLATDESIIQYSAILKQPKGRHSIEMEKPMYHG